MQLIRKILREAEEALEKLNTYKARLTEEHKHQVKLAKGKIIGAKKQRVLAGLAIEEGEQLRNIDKFMRETLFHSLKKIAPANKGNAEEIENNNGGDNNTEKKTSNQKELAEKYNTADKEPEDNTATLVTEEPPERAREPNPKPVRGKYT